MNIQQRKSLSQVFLNTDWPVRKMVDKLREWGVERVLEIGPGDGILTKVLLEAGFEVTAIEKDERFATKLKEAYQNEFIIGQRLTVHHADVLRVDLAEWIQASPKKNAVVGNIPYHISSPILVWAIPQLANLVGAQFMVQLEFAERIAAEPDTKEYGSLSVYCHLRAKTTFECKVEKTCFTPVPKVDSAIISMQARTDVAAPKLLGRTESVCRASFSQRRKKLRNGIKPFMKDRVEEECPIDLNRRAETLTPEDFLALTKFLFPEI